MHTFIPWWTSGAVSVTTKGLLPVAVQKQSQQSVGRARKASFRFFGRGRSYWCIEEEVLRIWYTCLPAVTQGLQTLLLHVEESPTHAGRHLSATLPTLCLILSLLSISTHPAPTVLPLACKEDSSSQVGLSSLRIEFLSIKHLSKDT